VELREVGLFCMNFSESIVSVREIYEIECMKNRIPDALMLLYSIIAFWSLTLLGVFLLIIFFSALQCCTTAKSHTSVEEWMEQCCKVPSAAHVIAGV